MKTHCEYAKARCDRRCADNECVLKELVDGYPESEQPKTAEEMLSDPQFAGVYPPLPPPEEICAPSAPSEKDWQARALAAERLVKELETEIAKRDWQAAQSATGQRSQAATWPFPQEVWHWRERALKAEAELAELRAVDRSKA